jgi:hypothetical protein
VLKFNNVKDNTTSEQKEAIWEWCKDHTENFGCIPMEYAEWNDEKGDDDIWDYDQMLSALTEEQIDELDKLIDAHAHAHESE